MTPPSFRAGMKNHMTESLPDRQTRPIQQGQRTLPLPTSPLTTTPPGTHRSSFPAASNKGPPPNFGNHFSGIDSEWNQQCILLLIIIIYFLFLDPQRKHKRV